MRRSTFNLSHRHLTSFDQGYLVPVMTEEVLPGDTFRGSTNVLARVAPLVHPIMHNVEMAVHHWYVPNRIIWDQFEDFITGENDALSVPTITLDTDLQLCDHFGIYPETGLVVNALPFRAYNKIYNDRYRDQDLQTARAEDADTLARVCWGKDYFTTARAQPTQGDAVEIGFSAGQAPVTGIGVSSQTYNTANATAYETGGAGSVTYANARNSSGSGAGGTATTYIEQDPNNAGFPNIYADLSQATGGINIDDFRRSMALQRFAEARAMFGDRYEDYLQFLGINPSTGRLDRPEYLGGHKERLDFSEVLATAEGTTVEVGDLYGHGIGAMGTRTYQKMFEEHGWLLTLVHVRPRTQYLQALPKKFTRSDVMDFWQKELEVLPWQEVKRREIYAPGGDATTTFGYVPRFEEYRHAFDYVSGSFRSTELDWHMARNLTSAPTLNSSFVECTPTDRIYSDTSMPEILANVYNKITARRLVRQNTNLRGV